MNTAINDSAFGVDASDFDVAHLRTARSMQGSKDNQHFLVREYTITPLTSRVGCTPAELIEGTYISVAIWNSRRSGAA
jgi:hypothetical protein